MMNIILLIVAYLVGSIPSAILVCKAMKLPDPRDVGSGNPGTTNVFRIGGKLPAVLVFAADILKGIIPVLLASLLGVTGFMLAVIVLVTAIGHMYPAFTKFQGGKGMATAFGGMLVLNVTIALLAIIVWAIIIGITRYVSLASLVAAVLVPVLILFVQPAYFLPLAVLTALIFWKHLTNIQRLKGGSEDKVDVKKFSDDVIK